MASPINPGPEGNVTPAMRQYFAAKQTYPDCLLFFRMGDFYELFYDDALVAARELQLTLTSRDKHKAVPMCGVPFHAGAAYLQRLLRKGYKVALCEQMEDPKLAKGVVKREVTRVLTPGTALDAALDPGQSQWLAAIAAVGSGSHACIGVASVDLSTGDMHATEFAGPSAWALALDELARMRPAETLLARGSTLGASGKTQIPFGEHQTIGSDTRTEAQQGDAAPRLEGARTELDDWIFTEEYAVPLLRQGLRVHSLDGMGLGGHTAAAVAAGAIVHYLRATKQGALEHLDTVRFYEHRDCLELDAVSVRNLELVEPIFSGEGTDATLLHTLDACCTPMGKRLLRAQLLRPSSDLGTINARLDAVALATADIRRREAVRRAMSGLLDLERLLGRIALDSAGPREVAALGATLSCLPGLQAAVADLASQGNRWAELAQLNVLQHLHDLIARTLVADPPVHLNDGGAIRPGVDAELDELRDLGSTGRQRIAAIEERERERTGIASLKVRFNSVFGYYLEVTRANLKAVPPDYERKQTLVNAERFTTPELKDLETKILTAQERSSEIEKRLFEALRRDLLADASRVRDTARHVAEIDLLANFAHLAALRGWTRPIVDASSLLEVIAGRHPVVERRLEESGAGRFVPNSLRLAGADDQAAPGAHHFPAETPAELPAVLSPNATESADPAAPPPAAVAPSLLLITGPNMGGKSTFLRQAALLTIMAQCGSFVPAERMHLGLVDRIYTRIGAADNVARGRSTFMVEMTETAAILNTATARSLVLLDEMGRGTATYDGLSLAWATVEHLHDRVGARTLFATHYHELTLLAGGPTMPGAPGEPVRRGGSLPRMQNARVTVRERDGGIVFLHTVEPGPASKSYGIEVARLAGLPANVIHRAREVLRIHERTEAQGVTEAAHSPTAAHLPRNGAPALQLTMFTPLSQRIVDRLAALDLDNLTPREALTLLAELQTELRTGSV